MQVKKEKEAAQSELDDLLMVFADLEEQAAKQKVRIPILVHSAMLIFFVHSRLVYVNWERPSRMERMTGSECYFLIIKIHMP